MNHNDLMNLLDDITSGPDPDYSAIKGSTSNTIGSDQFNLAAKPLNLTADEIRNVEADFGRELNNLRDNPSSFVSYLQNDLKPTYSGNIVRKRVGEVVVEQETREGLYAVDDAISELQRAASAPYMHDAHGLNQACKKSCQTMGSIGLEITNTSTTMTDYGTHEGSFSSVALFGRTTARDFLLDFLVSDGDPSRTFRRALLNPKYKVYGVAYGPHSSTYQTMICVVLAEGWKDKK